MIFTDFETDDLYGNFTEGTVIDNGCNIHNFSEFNDLLDHLIHYTDSGHFVMFWSHWHVRYIQTKDKSALDRMHGHYLVFCDIYTFMFETWKSGHNAKIDEMTQKLCKRKHIGNSKQDCIDLCDSFGAISHRR